MNEAKLNLARKWRSRNFDQIIGQDLLIRMLKNTLYLGQHFPVYLFSGQRGCGKTTTARVFATALNCEQLTQFQEDPQKITIPCLSCRSCVAMSLGNHPDFIEIDAASHTGVDNVRSIIEASSLLPILGFKKIYLIDEAHMLSKAAFNAFLKILEEPPSSVLFILATTDPQKIIETVRSRCFQLFFKPIDSSILFNHIKTVCTQEDLPFEDQGLQVIVKESEGSARDALNLLEQVRFSSNVISKDSVLQILGHINDANLVELFKCILNKKPRDILQCIQDINMDQFSAEYFWKRCIELVRVVLWLKHGVVPKQFAEYHKQLTSLVNNSSLEQLTQILEMLYSNEAIFNKTVAKHTFLEMLFVRLNQNNSSNNDNGSSSPLSQIATNNSSDEEEEVEDEEQDESEYEDEDDEENTLHASWNRFIYLVQELKDPLIHSIFTQGCITQQDVSSLSLHVEFSKDLVFFKDWIEETKPLWSPLLKKSFNQDEIVLNPLFVRENVKKEIKHTQSKINHTKKRNIKPQAEQQKYPASYRKSWQMKKENAKPYGIAIDVSDTTVWKKANLLLHYFPGKITEVREQVHG